MKKIIFLFMFPSFLFGQVGLIGSYPFNGNANDVSGNGNNGVVNNATLTSDRFGSSNSAYHFNGFSDFIDLGTNFNYNSHSYSAWVKMDSAPVFKSAIISKISNGAYDTKNSELAILGTKKIEIAIGTGATWEGIASLDSIHLNEWTLLTYTYDSNTNKAKFYTNNVLTDSSNITSYFDVNGISMYVGARPFWSGTNSTTFYFKGIIDDINIYDKPISNVVVDSLYNYNPLTNINSTSKRPLINIYPNPAHEQINIELPKGSFMYLEIFDITGKMVLKTNKIGNIDISHLEKGVYTCRVFSNEEVYVSKLLKY